MSSSPSSSELPAGFADEVGDAAARALAAEPRRWHRCDSDGGCEVDVGMVARIVAEAALAMDGDRSTDGRISAARLRELRERVDRLQELAEVAQQLHVWDHRVYDQTPDDQWLAIDRDDHSRLVDALARVDSWEPWAQPLERRLGDL